MLLFYQINMDLIRLNKEKTGGYFALPPAIKLYENVVVFG
jgi:hypothetical protein